MCIGSIQRALRRSTGPWSKLDHFRCCFIMTFRPEFRSAWAELSNVTSVTLNRLRESEATAIVARLDGNREIPAKVMSEIVQRTDGIPLFVEEMTKAVLEAE